jgi:hypothetical protein
MQSEAMLHIILAGTRVMPGPAFGAQAYWQEQRRTPCAARVTPWSPGRNTGNAVAGLRR